MRVGATYHYIAWGASAGLAGGASYTGDGADNRNLTVMGFRPDLLFLARASAAPVFRTRSMSGDLTFPTGSQAGIANSIESTRPQGFQVGNDLTANETGRLYHVAGLRDALGADVGVTLTANTTTPSIGDTLIYTARATNYGPQPATGITLLDPLPAQLSWISAVPSQGVFDTTSGVWNAGSLANGAFATLVMRGRVKPGTAGASVITRSNRTGSSPTDAFADDDADSVIATVQYADLDVSTSVDDVTPTEGEVVVYTVRVDNLGPNTSTGISISSALPAGIGYLSVSTTSGTYAPGTGLWSIASIASAASATMTLRGTVAGGTAGSNPKFVARVADTDQFDPIPGNDADSVTVSVRLPRVRVLTGTYVGNGAISRAITGIGFQPDLVLIKGAATGAVLRTKSMSGDAAKDLSVSAALVTGRIRSVDGDGFHARLRPFGQPERRHLPLDRGARSYRPGAQGLSTPAMASTIATWAGLGFAPAYAIVIGDGARPAVQRFGTEVGDASLLFTSNAEIADRVQAFQADGFQVGTSADVNASGATYHYIAWGASAGLTGGGSYTGDGADNRNLTVTSFRPDLLFLARASAAPAFRTRSMSGDLTFPADAQAGIANSIQSTRPQGFQVGNDATANEAGRLYHVAGLRDALGADIGVTITSSTTTPNVGDTLVYTARATNYGPETATGVTLLDPLPPQLSWISAVPSQGAFDTTSGVWDAGSIANGAFATLVMRGRVKPGTAGATVIAHSRRTGSSPTDAFADDDADSVSTTVQLADLDVTVSIDDVTPTEGEVVVYTVRLDNLGPNSATGVAISSALPAGLNYLSASATSGSYSSGSGLWTVGSIASAASASLTLRGTVAAGSAGTTPRLVARQSRLARYHRHRACHKRLQVRLRR